MSGIRIVFERGICADDGRLRCPECRSTFSCLPKPEPGCEPVGSVHQDFTSDSFLLSAQCCGVIDDIKCKVSQCWNCPFEAADVWPETCQIHTFWLFRLMQAVLEAVGYCCFWMTGTSETQKWNRKNMLTIWKMQPPVVEIIQMIQCSYFLQMTELNDIHVFV